MKGQGMKRLGKSAQSGFTLIELIMVVVILGILSAVAIPRFADLGSEARTASIEGLAGALKSSSAIVHAKWLAGGGTASLLVLEDETINLTSVGYPNAASISDAAQVDTTNDYPAATAGAVTTYTLKASCTVAYNDGTTVPSAIVSPTVSIDTSGC